MRLDGDRRREWLATSGFPERLREARKQSGLSLLAAEMESGVPHTLIGMAENGRVVPSIMNVAAQARAMEVSVDWLVYGADWEDVR